MKQLLFLFAVPLIICQACLDLLPPTVASELEYDLNGHHHETIFYESRGRKSSFLLHAEEPYLPDPMEITQRQEWITVGKLTDNDGIIHQVREPRYFMSLWFKHQGYDEDLRYLWLQFTLYTDSPAQFQYDKTYHSGNCIIAEHVKPDWIDFKDVGHVELTDGVWINKVQMKEGSLVYTVKKGAKKGKDYIEISFSFDQIWYIIKNPSSSIEETVLYEEMTIRNGVLKIYDRDDLEYIFDRFPD